MSSWTTPQTLQFLLGIFLFLGVVWLFRILFLSLIIEVEDDTAVLVTRFGKLVEVIREPGARFLPLLWLPWYRTIAVSLQRDFRHYQDININDSRGTSMLIDLWIEFRIVDPVKALFGVEDWEHSLQGLLIHSATSVLSSREFSWILCERVEISKTLRAEIVRETSRWGIEVEFVFVRKVGLLPDVSRQMFDAVGAQLEIAKAQVEEEGRLRIAMLEAKTSARIAELVAEAKSQKLTAVGRAFAEMAKRPEVLRAYCELYEFSLVDPDRLVSFQGFEASEVRPLDAAMVVGGTPSVRDRLPRPAPHTSPST